MDKITVTTKTITIVLLLSFLACTAMAQGNCCCKQCTKMEQTKTLNVKEVAFGSEKPTINEIDSIFNNNNIEFHSIDTESWEGYEYHPEVKFRIAYSATEIYLQYQVKECCVKAVYGEDKGSSPYKDSCLEFFCIPDETNNIYYNLELNCIAKGTFAGGEKRNERNKFGDDVLSQIRRHSTLGDTAFGTKVSEDKPFEYTITVALPVKLFSMSDVKPLKGRTIRANFYKCGDDMPQPHYLSWNRIGTEKPNFHVPAYFGNIHFE